MEKISIIIPIYNSEKYLKECLKSIKEQTYSNYEVIMVNDGSTDKSELICRDFLNDTRFKIINQKNMGVAVARNSGLNKAKGKYVLFVDSDDWLDKDMLSVLINNVEESELLSVGYYNVFKNNKIEVTNGQGQDIVINQNLEKCIMDSNNMIGGYLWNKLFDLNIIRKNNIFFDKDINYCEDLIFVLTYIRFVNKIRYIAKTLYFYRMRKTSITKQGISNKKNMSILKALDILIEMNKDNTEIVSKLEFEYILYYYQFKRIITDKELLNYRILKKKNDIVKRQNIKKRLEIFLVKYFYGLYIFLKKMKNYKNIMFE